MIVGAGVLTSCAVARWQVAVTPLHGQSAEQQAREAAECDTDAKAGSGYDRGVEAKTWLWGLTTIPAAIVTGTVLEAGNLATFGALEPELKSGGQATTEAMEAMKPEGNPKWGGYFDSYRSCMRERGYSTR